MKQLITIVMLLVGAKSFAQSDTLTSEQAKSLVDKKVIVKAIIAGSRLFDTNGKRMLLINLDKRYPNRPLTVVLYDEAYKSFGHSVDLDGKVVVVSEEVLVYNDKSQIVVSDVKNLVVVK